MAYIYLWSSHSSHPDRLHVRELLDLFELIRSTEIRHHCLVHSPSLQITLWDLQRIEGKYSSIVEYDQKRHSLFASDIELSSHRSQHQHTVIGTFIRLIERNYLTNFVLDIELSNFMLIMEERSVLTDFEKFQAPVRAR